MGISLSQRKLHSHASVIGWSALICSLVTQAHTISMGQPQSGLKCCNQAFCDWFKGFDPLACHPSPYNFYGAATEQIEAL
jgi:hypothetical protein